MPAIYCHTEGGGISHSWKSDNAANRTKNLGDGKLGILLHELREALGKDANKF